MTGDTTNAQFGNGAGNALRVRNPSDSMALHFVIPTTGYQNISVTYALESSSITSGQLEELFDYSMDGGTTWQSSSLTVNGTNVDTLDVTQPQFQGANWGIVTVGFSSDDAVNNNPNLILRIRFAGNTSKTSGNNRIENVTVDGTALGQAENATASISVSAPQQYDTLYAGMREAITYAAAGPVTGRPHPRIQHERRGRVENDRHRSYGNELQLGCSDGNLVFGAREGARCQWSSRGKSGICNHHSWHGKYGGTFRPGAHGWPAREYHLARIRLSRFHGEHRCELRSEANMEFHRPELQLRCEFVVHLERTGNGRHHWCSHSRDVCGRCPGLFGAD